MCSWGSQGLVRRHGPRGGLRWKELDLWSQFCMTGERCLISLILCILICNKKLLICNHKTMVRLARIQGEQTHVCVLGQVPQ